MSDKIKSHHLDRKAILYVRQSSTHQVTHNQESRLLQYAMRDRLHELGWREIEVVDDDLGRSAAGSAVRAGFERMVAEVCLGKVGAVAAREVSRFARNSRDWQQLIEMCRVVDTLLVDQEMIYAPRQGNDRLLLGLKGSLNEYELDLLRQRSLAARHEKARRGELIVMAPVGYLKTDDQRLKKDPDQRVQEATAAGPTSASCAAQPGARSARATRSGSLPQRSRSRSPGSELVEVLRRHRAR
jgi:DNA invertase Pin-like site-specific DNA recombinase